MPAFIASKGNSVVRVSLKNCDSCSTVIRTYCGRKTPLTANARSSQVHQHQIVLNYLPLAAMTMRAGTPKAIPRRMLTCTSIATQGVSMCVRREVNRTGEMCYFCRFIHGTLLACKARVMKPALCGSLSTQASVWSVY